MKRDKILLTISNMKDITEYKKLGITNFLFPLKDYSIGYESFSMQDIVESKANAYVLINRLLEDEDIDDFLNIDIPKNVKGFIVEDVGLIQILKDKSYEVILYQNHLNNNYKTVNHRLKSVDNLVISTDITEGEIIKIVKNASKSLVLNAFGYPMVMYSRRLLVSNFTKHINAKTAKSMTINESRVNQEFFLKESDYGTAVFYNTPFDYRSIIDRVDDKIKFYLVDTNFFDISTIKDVIEGKPVNATRGFLDTKTVYRIGDIK